MGRILVLIFIFSSFLRPLFPFDVVLIKYPKSDYYNARKGVSLFLKELKERTTINVNEKIFELSLEDIEIFEHYFLILNGHVPVELSEVEKKNLKIFLENGGFLFANDDYGMDKSFRKLMKEIFPDKPLVRIPFSHRIYHCFYHFQSGIPKIHEHDGGPPEGLGIFFGDRLAVFYAFNTDIMDGWDPVEVHNDPPEKREEAIRMGINIVVYSLEN
ncbi:MAG: DUF4159 domain-containing protein [Brevinematia bacterium]